MLIDTIIFNNENELFKIRYEELKDIVDKFIVVEADTIHSGIKKGIKFINDYPKVEYYFILMPDLKGAWDREEYQRNYIQTLIFNDEDIIIHSDCDEIPNERIRGYNGEPVNLSLLNMNCYINAMVESDPISDHAFMGKWKELKQVTFRDRRMNPCLPKLENAGWHLSYIGGYESVLNKLSSNCHQEHNTEQTRGLIRERLNNFQFVLNGLPLVKKDIPYPKLIRNNLEHYKEMGWIRE